MAWLQVFEPPVRNSGIAGGKFLERQPVYKPNSEDVYTYTDLYVGATLEIFNRTFELTEADEYTYTYMENNKHVFIMADHEVLLKSLRAQVRGQALLLGVWTSGSPCRGRICVLRCRCIWQLLCVCVF